MDALSELTVSPEKLRYTYHITSKSKNKQKHSLKSSIELKRADPHIRQSLTPHRSNKVNFSLKLSRLQEELDSEELSLKLSKLRSLSPKSRILQEKNTYKGYLNDLIELTVIENRVLGKALERGWKGFLVTLSPEPISPPCPNPVIYIQAYDQSTQVIEEMLIEGTDLDLEYYVNTLQRLSKNLNQMQTTNICEKLRQLTSNLKPVDIPSKCETPDIPEVDFANAVKIIHTKFKEKLASSPKKPVIKVSVTNKASQTTMKMEDLTVLETTSPFDEKEIKIMEMSLKLRKLHETEEFLKHYQRENEELKKENYTLKYEGCPFCLSKKEQIEKTNLHIRELQMTVSKGVGIEKELEVTKKKLVESLNTISLSNTKITKLSSNVDELSLKIEETRIQREALQKKLVDEERIRETVQIQLRKEQETNVQLRKAIEEYCPEITSILNKSDRPVPRNKQEKPVQRRKEGEKVESHTKSVSRTPVSLPISSKSATPENKRSTQDKVNRIKITREVVKKERAEREEVENIEDIEEVSNTREDIRVVVHKSKRKKLIMETLGISKKEYMELSKKDRIELFEALYEHKDKCGADCEHLKKAMMIRYRCKGVIFPVKKYNINSPV